MLSTGAIAQLGERLLCKQEVVGSIPSGSTSCFDAPYERSRVRYRAPRSVSAPPAPRHALA
jgi:hypothetical protein